MNLPFLLPYQKKERALPLRCTYTVKHGTRCSPYPFLCFQGICRQSDALKDAACFQKATAEAEWGWFGDIPSSDSGMGYKGSCPQPWGSCRLCSFRAFTTYPLLHVRMYTHVRLEIQIDTFIKLLLSKMLQNTCLASLEEMQAVPVWYKWNLQNYSPFFYLPASLQSSQRDNEIRMTSMWRNWVTCAEAEDFPCGQFKEENKFAFSFTPVVQILENLQSLPIVFI